MAIFSLAAQNRHRLLPDDYRVIRWHGLVIIGENTPGYKQPDDVCAREAIYQDSMHGSVVRSRRQHVVYNTDANGFRVRQAFVNRINCQ